MSRAFQISAASGRGLSGRAALLSGASALMLLAASFPAFAQDDQSSGGQQVETVVVTGSRIRQAPDAVASPIQALDTQALAKSGASTVTDAINQLPQVGTAFNNQSQSINAVNASRGVGTSLINLRDLGTQRTLTLVDGDRFVGGNPGTSSVDLNTIPSILIDRVDVVTGAATAVYGADAVSGVVNLVLKDHFDGLDVSLHTGISQQGDGTEYAGSFLYGGTFDGGKGDVVLAYEHSTETGVSARDRSFSQYDGGNWDQMAPNFGSTSVPGGLITNPATKASYVYNSAGQLVPSAQASASDRYFQRAPWRDLEAPQVRDNVASIAHYKLLDGEDFSVNAYARVIYSHIKTDITYEPEFLVFGASTYGTQFQGNTDAPYIPASNPYAQALAPTIGAIPAQGVGLSKRFDDVGPQRDIVNRDTYSFTGGFTGNLPHGFQYDLYYEFGRVTSFEDLQNVVSKDRVIASQNVNTNGSSNPADWSCADPEYVRLGCVPVNLFGNAPLSQAFLNYAEVPASVRTVSNQTVVSGSINGDLFQLPAGAVGVALGADYRKEQTQITPSENVETGDVPKNLSAVKGQYDVSEVFGEINVPVLKDVAFARDVTVGGAVRYSDYSSVGSQTSWNLHADWTVNSWVRFRGTYGTAIRAPNILELYSPKSQVISTVQDPCDTAQAGGVPAAAQASCAAALGALGVNPATFTQSQTQRNLVSAVAQGNPDLKPESSRTFTVGTVLTPTGFLDGLMASVDYYNIKINNVISTLNVQTTANQCYTQPNMPATYCSLISRGADGALIAVNQPYINAAQESEDGLDISVNDTFDLEPVSLPGTLQTALTWSHVFDHDFIAYPGAPVDRYAGQVGGFAVNGSIVDRVSLGLTYNIGGFSFYSNTREIGPSYADTSQPLTTPGNHIGAYWYEDIQGSYVFGSTAEYEAALGIRNLFDKDPPIVATPARIANSGSTTPGGEYDDIGRYFYLNFKLHL